ncbi:MAG: polysaccharide biosynthesis C-terminal domain-containing protein [Firmicutes bacterium]|nr:polysaccharide biosynthesis C-terminal domain-containing protein [Bacillota bacterium]
MDKKLRSEKTLKNAAWSIAGYLAYAIVGFVSRSIFVRSLGETLTGVSTLFSSILNLLSMAELGFSGAIAMHLYQPVAEGDERKIAALLNLYRKAYRFVAVAVFAIGMALLPGVPLLTKSDTAIPHLRWYFFLYLLRTVLSYCYAYKGTLISVCQEEYRRTNITNALLIVTTLAQTLVLHYTANFTWYLVIALLGTLLTNLLIHREAGKLYPYLDQYREEKVSEQERKSIFDYIKAASLNRISLSIKAATDNMITSAFVSVVTTGIVGNYVMVTGTVEKLLGFFFWNCEPAVGNLTATADKESQYYTFLDLEYVAFWVYGFLTAGMLCVLTPFVRDIWIRRPDMILGSSTLLLLLLNFFLTGINFPSTIFFDVRGLIRKMPYINVLNLLVNLVVSLALVKWLDVDGVYIGTVLSLALTTLPLTQYLVLRYHFDGNYRPYLRLCGFYLVVTLVCCGVSFALCALVTQTGLVGVAAKIILCTVSYNAIFLLASFRTREFRSLSALMKKILHKERS